MGQADQLGVEGRPYEAAEKRYEAAEAEAQVFALLPLDRPKTRAITAISSVALYREAGALDQAIRQAQIFLANDDLMSFARRNLTEMIDEMRAEMDGREAENGLSDGARQDASESRLRSG